MLPRNGSRFDGSENAAGVAGGEDPLGNGPGDDASCADDGFGADLHAGTDDGSAADPDVAADLDGATGFVGSTEFGIHGVGGGVDLDGGSDQRMVPDFDGADIQHDAIEIHEDPFSEGDVRSVVTVEGGLDPGGIATGFEELLEKGAAGFTFGFAGGVELPAEVPAGFPEADQFGIVGVVKFSGEHFLVFGGHGQLLGRE